MLAMFLLINMVTLSFALPVMALEAVAVEPVAVTTVTEQEITPRTNMTRTYWRTYNGQLQMRVWSITNGRWMTDWMDL